jgi:pyruvate,water dikinase
LQYVQFLEEIQSDDFENHGGKAVNLARLAKFGFQVPRGFSISSMAFDQMVESNQNLNEFLERVDHLDDFEEVLEISEAIQKIIREYEIPKSIVSEISKALDDLKEPDLGFAVRSSATIEDRSDLSFAGQAESYLCIKKQSDVVESVKKVWQSVFSERAIVYLKTKLTPLKQVKMAVVVQEMVPADVSGVMFTANVVNNSTEEMLINSTWGLGDCIVAGKVVPDTFVLSKNPLRIIQRNCGEKKLMSQAEISRPVLVATPIEKTEKFSLDEQSLLDIAEVGMKVEMSMEEHQDIEWCIRPDGVLVLLQSRPITTLSAPSSHRE